MWYRTIRAQMNIASPFPNLPGYVPPSLPPASGGTDNQPGAPAPDQAAPIGDKTTAPNQQPLDLSGLPQPPLHDLCHCYVDHLPSGFPIWKSRETACPQCHAAQQQFNDAVNAQIPKQPPASALPAPVENLPGLAPAPSPPDIAPVA